MRSICIATSLMAMCCDVNSGIYIATKLSNSRARRLQQPARQDAHADTCSASGLNPRSFVYSAWLSREETCEMLLRASRSHTVSAPLTDLLADMWTSKAALCVLMHRTTVALTRRCNHTKWQSQANAHRMYKEEKKKTAQQPESQSHKNHKNNEAILTICRSDRKPVDYNNKPKAGNNSIEHSASISGESPCMSSRGGAPSQESTLTAG